jgi:hypothetical protein
MATAEVEPYPVFDFGAMILYPVSHPAIRRMARPKPDKHGEKKPRYHRGVGAFVANRNPLDSDLMLRR